ncbi:hybrid sensor histidine kinase/response regulator, partial [Arenibaculum sp.]|uniref:hybrid sensor histidine kinase/response regulator n=1 Tax=Arenibaculum sp. TaxID=2865862 RepID=UPI002E0FCCF9|nr:ATP-binding protein [Arenibaculum sp.]
GPPGQGRSTVRTSPDPGSRDRPLWVLFALSILLPLSLFVWTAVTSYREELADAERTATRTATALHEHVSRVLDTHEVVLDEIDRRIAGRSWEDIESDAGLRKDLVRIERSLEQIGIIALVDESGRVRATSRGVAPPAAPIADRDYFEAQRERDAGTYVGAPFVSRVTGERLVALSRRRTTPDGSFDGIVQVAVPISYMTGFWKQFVPTIAHVIPFVRADGRVIARYPAINNPEWLDTTGPFLSRALRNPRGVYTAASQVDGVERLNAYMRIQGYPLFISFSMETGAILNGWYRTIAIHGAYTLLTVLALLGMSVMAVRRYRAQQVASRRWQEAADRLAREMAARERAEDALRQSQKMETLGQITGGLAHDFNNLLQTMASGLYVLSSRIPEDARAVADATMQAVERGAKLVHQLMAFSRRQQLQPQPVDLCALVAGMDDLLRRAVGDAVHVEVDVDAGLDPVMADPNQTEMAILNLAINARDAMAGSGRLTIAARGLDVARGGDGRLSPGRYVVLSVTDTGGGMPPDVQDRAFEPFFTTKEVGKGTGLGLSMVYGFAEQSGGTAEIGSHPGRGTTVSLYLPRADAAAPQGRAARQPSSAGGTETILLVEDEALGRMGIALALRQFGYRVHEARRGAEALETLDREWPIDLMIADYAMPGMSGIELAAAARRRHPDLRIMIITGHAAFSFDETGSGVSAVMRKPFRMGELAERIRAVLARDAPAMDPETLEGERS